MIRSEKGVKGLAPGSDNVGAASRTRSSSVRDPMDDQRGTPHSRGWPPGLELVGDSLQLFALLAAEGAASDFMELAAK